MRYDEQTTPTERHLMTRIIVFTGVAVVGGFTATIGLVNLGITLGRSGRWSR